MPVIIEHMVNNVKAFHSLRTWLLQTAKHTFNIWIQSVLISKVIENILLQDIALHMLKIEIQCFVIKQNCYIIIILTNTRVIY